MITLANHTYTSVAQAVMIVAHRGRKIAAKNYNCTPNEIHWGECLRQAWAVVKAELAKAAPAVTSVIRQVEALDSIRIYNRKRLSKWAQGFILDNASRVETYGENTRFSEKQEQIINAMYAQYC